MIKTQYIKTIDQVKNLVFEQERNSVNGRFRSSFFYRGVPDASYDLSTSLSRKLSTTGTSTMQSVSSVNARRSTKSASQEATARPA